MSEVPEGIASLSPEEKRKLLARLLKERSSQKPRPLSYGQRALWFLHRLNPASASYNVPWSWRVRSAVDISALHRAFQTLVDRHQILRTTYLAVNGEPAQHVGESVSVDFEAIDVAGSNDDALERQVSEEAHKPFDLERGPVMRVRLYSRFERDHVLLVTVHHIAYDLWSMMTLLNELGVCYAGYRSGASPALPPAQPYEEFSRWQGDMLSGPDGERLWNYWRDRMAGDTPPLTLPFDRPRQGVQSSRGSTYAAALPAALAANLTELARARGQTIFTVLLSAFQVLLARYSGETDIVVGSPMTGRSRPELQDVVGYCLNMVPLRGDLSGDPAFSSLLEQMRHTVLGALEHQDFPFGLLVERLRPKRDPSHGSLFHAMFSLNKAHRRDDQSIVLSLEANAGQLELGGLTLEFTQVAEQAVVDDLVLLVSELDGSFLVKWQYNADLFDRTTIARFARHYERLLESIAASPDKKISELSMLDPVERRELIASPHTLPGYPQRTIHFLFDEQVKKTPAAIAVHYGADQVSYAELGRRADDMARRLRARGVQPGTLVGLLVERSIEMVVGMLGILKAGGAYVPLDPSYPQNRLAFMIADSGAPIVITTQPLLERLPDPAPATVCFDSVESTSADAAPFSDAASPDHPAYVIYTSGSTGKPKGVVIPHRGVVRLVRDTDYVTLDSSDRIAQASNASFDAATFEIWGALLTGACVVGIEKDLALSPREFAAELRDRRITTLFLTTALFNQMAREAPGGFRTLRHVMFGGEAVDPGAVRQVLAQEPPARLLHVYGPTESTTFSSWQLVESVADSATTVPIGGPIGYTDLYVLDTRLQPVPIGVAGELYVGGDGLAHSYHGRPELTADRFVPDPFSREPGSRLYRTGDLVRWCRKGSIEFLGRVDHQVKIRGFRIEPGEIEAVLRQHASVQETLVDVRDLPGSGRSLVAYVVLCGEASSLNEVRGYLRERLPDYMVPSAWVTLESFPLTPNGKINRAALPAPDGARLLDQDFVAPQAGLEEQIASIWRDALQLDRVGTRDNFFDLGGHSLLAVQVHTKLRDTLRREFSIVDLFRFPTVEGLARHLSGDAKRVETPARAVSRVRRAAAARSDEAVAVIGMAGRFPGASDLSTFWANLRAGVESVRFFSDEELRQAGVDERLLADPRYVRARAVVDGVDLFDAAFFGYSPRDAELIDPQQRLFLECASEALERAGYDPDRYRGAIGVYGGSSLNGYLANILSHPAFGASASGLPALIGAGPDFLTTRVSYKLNLRGPSVTVQTACSTSLVAVHHACRSLLDGECDIALAGGVSIGVPVIRGHLHQEGGILSPDGHCRAFDASARGTVTGHGAGIVVLKRLSEAIADGDTIYAVVRGTAINNDGSGKIGYTAPSVEGQADVIALAQAAAGIDPDSVSYVEAHGTGTSLGDPIELTALMQVFKGSPGTCAIGSLKTNVGHLDAAAGVASVIKTVLALSQREIPPSLNFSTPNPKIDFASGPFVVNAALTPWAAGTGPRRAGVSSFGIGGTNAHAVLEEAPVLDPSGPSRRWQLVILSARTKTALEASTAQLAEHLRAQESASFPDIAYTLQVGRRIFGQRRFVVSRTAAEAVAALANPDAPGVVTGALEQGERSCIFMFSGQGSQYAGMAREIYDAEPQFRDDVDRCCEMLRPHLGWDLRDVLLAAPGTEAASKLKDTRVTQPALFVIEYALARLWMAWGIQPSALIGHSVGEYVAACLSGVFPLEDAIRLVAIRGQLMQSMSEGAMLAVPLAEADVQPLLGTGLSLAAVNSPSLSVVAGPIADIAAFEARLKAKGITGRRLETSHAFHSAMMEPVLDRFREEVARAPRRAPEIPFISNVTGTWITEAEAVSPDYWTRHLRGTVRFSDGVQELLKDPARVFLEVGPGRTLATLVRQADRRAASRMVLTTLRHPMEEQADEAGLLHTLGRLWLAGLPVDWNAFWAHESRRRVPLPTYPFERQRYWIEAAAPIQREPSRAERAELADWFYAPSWKRIERPAVSASDATKTRERWLVFGDGSDGSSRVVDRLIAGGHEVVRVTSGSMFEQRSESLFVIDPANVDHYQQLVRTLKAAGRMPAIVGHFWGVTPEPPAEPAASAAFQDRGFFSLLFLAQAVGATGWSAPVRLAVVTTNLYGVSDDDVVCPSKATVLGPLRVIPSEYPNITCRALDVVGAEWMRADDRLVQEFIEIARRDSGEPVVAVRGEQWSAPAGQPVRFAALRSEDKARLRDGGVYLITGGFGGIGLTLARALATRVKAKLVLTGRTALPERAGWPAHLASTGESDRTSQLIRAIEAIERAGGEVLMAAADVSKPDQVQRVVADALRRFGRLDGVIHSAGVGGGGIIQLKTVEGATRVLSPKVAGTFALADAVAGLNLDFFALCSSLTAFLGGSGQVDYCAANAFLDAFAIHHAKATGTFTVSINWDTWQQVGLAVATEVPDDLARVRAERLSRGITPEEGAEAFFRILAHAESTQIAVSTVPLGPEARSAKPAADTTPSLPQAAEGTELPRYGRPELATTYAAPVSEIEATIAEVWKSLLGIDRIGRDDNFFDLGGHSLLLVQAHATLAEQLGRELPVTDLFQFPTIASLAGHLGGDTRALTRAVPVSVERSAANAIAIVGMSGRFPGASDLDRFWANLRDGVESIQPVSDEELRRAGVDERSIDNPRYVKVASALDGIDLFDAAFFGYAPREAELIDPQHRVFLECAWEALERAGYDPRRYPGSIGVYAGASWNSYLAHIFANPEIIQTVGALQAGIANRSDHLPTRTSYKLNLRGPSINVQTACSTSLVAVHEACRSLVDGECDMALAGGVSISVSGKTGYLYIDEGIGSPDGHCRAFDARAQGTVWGDGVGVVVLKRLADAVRDGDHIHAVIRGTAINNDGSVKVGYSAPSVEGQALVIAKAQAVAGVEPSSIGYIEAHGTGTTLGDPIEIAALREVFGHGEPGTCAIGTLKTNLGHLDSAAGVAGLIKTALSLECGEMAPSLNFDTPNPKIDFASSPFFVNTAIRPWPARETPRRAGVSSFGIGGTNAHAVLEEAPAPGASGPSRPYQVMPVSARTRRGLEQASERLAAFLDTHPDLSLADAAYTLQIGRAAFPHRRIVVARDPNEAIASLRQSRTPSDDGAAETGVRSCVFLFSGQGAQYPGMAGDLYQNEASFRADVDECCDALTPHLGLDLRELLFAGRTEEAAARLKDTKIAQPALFVIEYALARLWMRWGVRPAALIGHSLGEYVAACISGVWSLEDALSLVAARGRLIQSLPAGAMLAVPLSEQDLAPLLGQTLSLAAVNGPALSVASGPIDAIDALDASLAARGITARRLETSHAFHSALMEPAIAAFRAELTKRPCRPPQIPLVSNLTGGWIEAMDADYWVRHLRQPVRFMAGVETLLEDANRVFLEVGPGRTLASLARLQNAARGRTILTSVRHAQETHNDQQLLLQTLGQLWVAGLPIDWSAFSAGESRRRIPLPTYPFERQRYWIDRPQTIAPRATPEVARKLEKNANLDSWFYVPAWESAPLAASTAPRGAWLVFEDEAGIGAQLADLLRRDGQTCSRVRAGAAFSSIGDDRYSVAAGSASDYESLIGELARKGRTPDHIVHLWSVGSAAPSTEQAGVVRERGFYSALLLAQALGRQAAGRPFDLIIAGNGLNAIEATDTVSPEKAMLAGLGLVIPQEFPHIRCVTVDLPTAVDDRSALAERLRAEAAASGSAVIAYRGAQRLEPVFKPAPLASTDDAGSLRDRGVYLLSGGLGNIGLAIAAALAESVRARLVLIGRSTPPAREHWQNWLDAHASDDRTVRQIRAIQALEARGAEVLVEAADVADVDQMRAVVSRVLGRYGAINGVIHAAGTVRGQSIGSLQSLSRADCEEQLRPKADGILAMARAVAHVDLDFFLTTSSLSAILGGLGFGAYAAANRFLDAFVESQPRSTRTRWISIDLDGWAFEPQAVQSAVGALEMQPAEGVESIIRILRTPSLTRVAVSTSDLEARVSRYARRAQPGQSAAADHAPTSARYARPDVETVYAAPNDELEQTIAEIWQALLAIDQIGRDDNFFDLGGHSLLLVQAQATLTERLGRSLPVTDLFQFPTVRALAAHLGGQSGLDIRRGPVAPPVRTAADASGVAIIGMTGRFPGAPDLETFWANLRGGVESIQVLTDEDLRQAGVDEETLRNPSYVKATSTIDDIDLFDAGFFGYAPREADLLDPQARLFLECAWETLERAGYDPKRYPGLIGVFAGSGSNGYLANIFSNPEIVQAVGTLQATMGTKSDHLPTRVSYKLNLRGPSLNVQTACSTSLVAVHQAFRSLVEGECDMALAGGVSVAAGMGGRTGYFYQEEGILSPDGHCRSFDARAQGTVWGDGVGVVLLKRLSDALANGDTIHAVIRGTAINNDGAVKVGYTAPSVEGQAAVIARAQAVAGVDPGDISYIEAHGTGTALGDPIEIAALSKVFGPLAARSCAIGTLKSNVGHLDAAAGVAGLIKTTLALAHRELPPSLHFETPNPKINFSSSPFFVNTDLQPWENDRGKPRRAGVSAFGIGGTNAHAVLEEAPSLPPSGPSRALQVLVLSARTRSALDKATSNLAEYLAAHPDAVLADVAYTLQTGRRPFAHRRTLVAQSVADAASALAAPDRPPVATASVDPGDRLCVFLFSGQGAQYPGMARELYESDADFRADVDACCAALVPHLDCDLRAILYPAADDEAAARRLTETRYAQPALFVIEYAIARTWMRWGIQPAALIGHSVGEYVAACLAGVFTLDDALGLVAARGRLMQALPAGSMLAVPISEADLTPLLGRDVSLAAVNAPQFCVAAGTSASIDALEVTLVQRNIAARRLQTSHAFHSSMMDPVLEEFRAEVARAPRQAPRIPLISNVTGTWMTADEATSPEYWTRHLRGTVRFAAGVQELLNDKRRMFLEVGPGRTLSTFVRQAGQTAAQRVVLTSLTSPQEKHADLAVMLGSLGRLWLAGAPVDWASLSANERRRRVTLPTYPFERQRFWIDAPGASAPIAGATQTEPLTKNADVSSWFYAPEWRRTPRIDAGATARLSWLILTDERGVGETLAARLRADGHIATSVRAGRAFARIDGDFEVEPSNANDYQRLLEELADADRTPQRIIHLWSYGTQAERPLSAERFDRAQERGFYSLLALTQALGRRGLNDRIDLLVAGTELQTVKTGEVVRPEKSTILALTLVIPQEHPNIRCAAVDFASDDVVEIASQLLMREGLAGVTDSVVAYRGGDRFIQEYRTAALPEPPASAFRSEGVYLITGGLGNIGLAVATRLARDHRARLVLVSRSIPPAREMWSSWVDGHAADDPVSRQIAGLRAIEDAGGRVLVLSADVSDSRQMRSVIERARAEFGALHGVIHAAGVVQGGTLAPIQTLDRAACERQFLGKARGAIALEEAVSGLALDFCALTSSISAVLGGLGYAPYAAANQFLDSFADAHAGSGSTRWVSVNLDAWAFGPSLGTALSRLEMQPGEGVDALTRVLDDPSRTRVVVSTGNLSQRIDRYVRRVSAVAATAAAPSARHARPEITTAFAAPIDEIEQTIAEVWQRLLGIDQIGRNDNFFDLGGHSLLLIQAQTALNERLARSLAVTDLFQFPTIGSLAAHVAGARSGAPIVVARPVPRTAENAPNAIAVVGLAGRFPGAADVEQFWANLRGGIESIRPLGDEELRLKGVPEALLSDARYVKAASALTDIAQFDAPFFGYSPREAELLDPQHRLFLECAWEAMERAGYDPKRYAGQVGVFAGAGFSNYLSNVFTNPEIVEAVGALQAAISNRADYLPTRVSYKLDLRGPSINVQTACSTSLVVVHQACRSLVDGECDMALAGGVSVSVAMGGPTGYVYQEDGILSPDGHCRAFDEQAQGTVWGDGVGIVVLKRLADAIADGDIVHAVIRGTAINNDGSAKVGYTAPGVEGQAAVVARAQAVAGVNPDDITYIEAHGTGTALGDPIEVAALTQVFGAGTPASCGIGTVKSNVGHLDSAAGIAGLIKTVLAIEHREMPPSLHFKRPNAKIDFSTGPFFVNDKLRAWDAGGKPLRAGVSAFGIGGTNAHAIVEEAPAASASDPSRDCQLLLLSARSRQALESASARLTDHLRRHPDLNLADVAYTLQVGRQEFSHRRAVVCRTIDEAVAALTGSDDRSVATGHTRAQSTSVAFLFPGQGAQHVQMARELYRGEPAFRAIVDDCAEQLKPRLRLDLRDLLYPAESDEARATERLAETRFTQPALFVVEYALAQLWRSWGFEPRALLGHSIGEYVAACLAGVFSLEDALKLVAARGELMQSAEPGAMLAVGLAEDRVRLAIGNDVWLAAVNSPSLCVVGGPVDRIAALEAELEHKGIAATRLRTSHAFHSPMMDPIVERYIEVVRGIQLNAPAIPFVSNVTGTWISEADAKDPAYWGRHLRQPVRFADGLGTLLNDERCAMLEVGPSQTLSGLAKQHPLCSPERTVVATLGRPQQKTDLATTLAAAGRLWVHGLAVNWNEFYKAEHRRRVLLPTYPFERNRYWIEPKAFAVAAPAGRAELADWFHVPGWKRVASHPDADASGHESSERWLLFADRAGFAAQIERHLTERGHDVVVVEQAEEFEQRAPNRFAIDPSDRAHYDALLSALKSAMALPDVIGHLWNVADDSPDALDMQANLDRGFYSLLFLAQALGESGSSKPIRLAVITSGVHDVTGAEALLPSRATMLGPCRVIPTEYPHITCRAFDVVASEWQDATGSRVSRLVRQMAGGKDSLIAALRNGHLWVETSDATRIEASGKSETPRLRQHGVYLITGGTGGIGLTLAKYLARTVKARLILTSRRGTADPAVIEALEHDGAEVVVRAADVSDENQMQALVASMRKQFDRIDGVIHAAGVPGAGVVQLKTRDAAAAVLSPKVNGTRALADALAGQALDFFVLCSSTTALIGGGGQVDYCAANAYLDAFARDHAGRTGTFTVAINWGPWQQVGMAVDTSVPDHMARHRAEMLKNGITPDEGVEAFRRILAGGAPPQIVVSPIPLAALDSIAAVAPGAGAQTPVADSGHDRPDLPVGYVGPTNDLEQDLCSIWQELVGIKTVGIHDNFFDLGGHSLLATQLMSRMRRAFEVDLSLREFFDGPTVAELAELLMVKLLEEEKTTLTE